jgi:hypothetical protein
MLRRWRQNMKEEIATLKLTLPSIAGSERKRKVGKLMRALRQTCHQLDVSSRRVANNQKELLRKLNLNQ